jgi:hypothetical protein
MLARILAVILLMLPGAAFAEEWGAIAYSPRTGADGYSHNYDSKSQAQNAAMSDCNPSDCRIAVNFYNACGALAVGRGGWGGDWGMTRGEAQSNAIAVCEQYANNCRVQRWVCSQ